MNKRIALTLAVSLVAPAWLVTANAAENESQSQMQSEQSTTQAQDLMSMKAGDLSEKKLHNQAGESIGEIDRVVQNKQDNQLYAVVEVGGFLGLGQKEVAIPLDKIEVKNGNLTTRESMTKNELEQQTAYNKSDYQSVDKGAVLASISGKPASKVSFNDLDKNKDGYISEQEAKSDPQLANSWKKADTNQDGQISESEFSAFEAQQPEQKPEQMYEQKQQPEGQQSPDQMQRQEQQPSESPNGGMSQ